MEIKNGPVLRAIATTHKCALCGERYSGGAIGTLLCSYHPYTVLARSERTLPYFTHGTPPPPTRCKTCNYYHLAPGLRPQSIADAPGDDVYVGGCTRVDHTHDLLELLHKPYACLPEILRDQFVAVARDGHGHPLIDEPDQLTAEVPLYVPGEGLMALSVEACASEVMAMYANVDLEREARLAKRGPVISTISRIKGMRRHDADIVSRLYAGNSYGCGLAFIAFFIVPRIEQPGTLRVMQHVPAPGEPISTAVVCRERR